MPGRIESILQELSLASLTISFNLWLNTISGLTFQNLRWRWTKGLQYNFFPNFIFLLGSFVRNLLLCFNSEKLFGFV